VEVGLEINKGERAVYEFGCCFEPVAYFGLGRLCSDLCDFFWFLWGEVGFPARYVFMSGYSIDLFWNFEAGGAARIEVSSSLI
jgi:hypothetical protein